MLWSLGSYWTFHRSLGDFRVQLGVLWRCATRYLLPVPQSKRTCSIFRWNSNSNWDRRTDELGGAAILTTTHLQDCEEMNRNEDLWTMCQTHFLEASDGSKVDIWGLLGFDSDSKQNKGIRNIPNLTQNKKWRYIEWKIILWFHWL